MTPLDEMLSAFGARGWPPNGSCKVERDGPTVLIRSGGMQASVSEREGGLIEVSYEHAPHERTRERCSPMDAASLVEAVFRRRALDKIDMSNITGSGHSP